MKTTFKNGKLIKTDSEGNIIKEQYLAMRLQKSEFSGCDTYLHIHIDFWLVDTHWHKNDWKYINDLKYCDVSSLVGLNNVGLKTQSHPENPEPYSSNLKFIGTDNDRYNLEIAVKAMKRIEKGLEKLSEKYGPIESFEGYISRLADVLGIDKFLFVDSDYLQDSRHARYKVRQWINDYAEKYGKKKEVYNG